VAGTSFKCDLHNAKLKYFRSLNGLLGKMGSSPNVQLTLSLISSFCTPVLCYGIEAMRLNKSQINSLTFPYNSGFIKLFETYDVKTITHCQFYNDKNMIVITNWNSFKCNMTGCLNT